MLKFIKTFFDLLLSKVLLLIEKALNPISPVIKYFSSFKDKFAHALFVFTFCLILYNEGISIEKSFIISIVINVIYELLQLKFDYLGKYEWLDIAYGILGGFFAVVYIQGGIIGFIFMIVVFIIKGFFDVRYKRG